MNPWSGWHALTRFPWVMRMKDLLKTVTACIDEFCAERNASRRAAIVGGEAVILHGVPRTTIDIDVLLAFVDQDGDPAELTAQFSSFLRERLGDKYRVAAHRASKDPDDALKHDIVLITDTHREYKKVDILIANFDWELEGLQRAESPGAGELPVYPKAYLVGMKLLAGGRRDEEDIISLFHLMSESERDETMELARRIKKDRNLSVLLEQEERGSPKVF